MQKLLSQLKIALLALKRLVAARKSAEQAILHKIEPPAPEPIKEVPPTSPFKWATVQEARHSVRVICDQEKLTLQQKNLITAVIQAESGFKNSAKCLNKNKNGVVTSTDWGICQINDTKGWHIGPGLPFASVKDVLDHPDKAVRYMIKMFKAGKLGLWVAYKSGAYKKFL